MLDVNFIRQNPQKVQDAIKNRGVQDKVNFKKFLELDSKWLKLVKEANNLRSKRNELTKKISADPSKAQDLLKEASKLKETLQKIEKELKEVEEERKNLLAWIPNIPLEDVPLGTSEEDNVEFKAWVPGKGYLSKEEIGNYDASKKHMPAHSVHSKEPFDPVPHWELGESLDIIDLKAGAKVSGNRFYYLKNEGVLLVYGIFDLLFKRLIKKEGFMPMIVPLLVREKALFGTSHFPEEVDQVYKIDSYNVEEKNNLYLVGSSEPSLFAYHMDKTYKKEDLPIKMVSITPCFRSEAGSWGKDVRGIKRTHQFDKLEMDVVLEGTLEEARKVHEYLLSLNEWLLQALEIPYHIINMCTADLGYFAAAKKYDVEVWLPSTKEYMEVCSDSITTDYQARRLNIRYKDDEGIKYAFTVNDTGATHRLLIAILDHYQQKDGSLLVPKVLREYVGKEVIEPKKC